MLDRAARTPNQGVPPAQQPPHSATSPKGPGLDQYSERRRSLTTSTTTGSPPGAQQRRTASTTSLVDLDGGPDVEV